MKTAVHFATKKEYAVKIINVAAAEAGEDDEEGMTLEEIAEEIRLTMSLNNAKNAVKAGVVHSPHSYIYEAPP